MQLHKWSHWSLIYGLIFVIWLLTMVLAPAHADTPMYILLFTTAIHYGMKNMNKRKGSYFDR